MSDDCTDLSAQREASEKGAACAEIAEWLPKGGRGSDPRSEFDAVNSVMMAASSTSTCTLLAAVALAGQISAAPAAVDSVDSWESDPIEDRGRQRQAAPTSWATLFADVKPRLAELTAEWRDLVARRLQYLADAELHEEENGFQPRAGSLLQLIEFVRHNGSLPHPALTFGDDGYVTAIWRRSVAHIVSLEFLEADMVRYAVISPDDAHEGRVQRSTGLVDAEKALLIIRLLGGLA